MNLINKTQKDKPLNLYFDNAATSWPKPESVYRAVESHMRDAFGSAGRSGHTRTLNADRLVYLAREAVAELLGVSDPANIVFTLNGTDALNIALKGLLEQNDHVIHTSIDHNSVLRPLRRLEKDKNITLTTIPCNKNGYPDIGVLRESFQDNTRLLIINHASNVTGTIAPLAKMVKSAHSQGVPVLVDAAQSAGKVPIDIEKMQIDLLAFTGHKSLMGPTGTGGLYVKPGLNIKTFREGGTGSRSEEEEHPTSMPEKLEAGTLNNMGLSGLLQGISFIQEVGLETIAAKEIDLSNYITERLEEITGINLFKPENLHDSTAIITFTLDGADSGEIGYLLESNYGVICRTGLHCAPQAHKAIGTFPAGTLRLSPGYFHDRKDADYLIKAIKDIASLVNG